MHEREAFVSRQAVIRQLQQETAERLSRIDREMADGFDLINRFNDTITVFGSARFGPEHRYYQAAEKVAGTLARQGYAIITGGGPGIMEAANKGAFEAGCDSIGLGIDLPHEQGINQYTTQSMSFHYFFSRKVILAFGATGYIYFPGGYGTLDELTEIITLIQTNKMPIAPIILYGVDFWRGWNDYIRHYLLEFANTISPADPYLYTVTDDIDEIVHLINSHRQRVSTFAASSHPIQPSWE